MSDYRYHDPETTPAVGEAVSTGPKREKDWHEQMERQLKQEIHCLKEEMVDLYRQLRHPGSGSASNDPEATTRRRVLRLKDVTLPTYDGNMSVTAVNDFLITMERGLRTASLQSLGLEVPPDDSVWSNAAIMQLRNPGPSSENYPGALEWANNKWIPGVNTTPTWATFKRELKDRFIPSSARQRAVRAFDDLTISGKDLRMDCFNQEFLRAASNVKLATGEGPLDLLGAYIKKLDRSTGKDQLAIDYEKWIFDIEQRGDHTPDLVTTMAWVERLDERLYHRYSEGSEVKPDTSAPEKLDAESLQASVTRVITEVMEARLGRMGLAEAQASTGNLTPPPRCWRCNKKGHIRTNCPLKARTERPGFSQAAKPYPSGGPAPQIATTIRASSTVAQEAVQELFSTNANSNTNNLLRFNGQVRWWDGKSSSRSHKTAYTLMDNAASDLFVSRTMANSLVAEGGGKIVNTGKMVRVKVATEREPVLKNHEKIMVNLWLGGHHYERWMTVLDMDEYDIILGKPWYTEMNGCHTIDYERNAVWIHPRRNLNPDDAASETEADEATKPDASWTGMLLGLRAWEGKGCRRRVNHDMDSVNAMLSKVQVVWGGGTVDRDARKKKGAFLVRLRNIQDPQEVEKQDIPAAFTRGLEKDFADVFEAPRGIPIRWKDGKAVEMHIELAEDAGTPFKTPYRLSRAETEELVKVLTIALEKGWIRPSTSSFGAPVLFVPKKAADGSLTKLRMVIDYRELNKLTKKDRYPLPLIDDLMDGLEGSRVFSKMDLASGYNQLGVAEEDRHKTAFVTKFGLFEWTVVPFGLANAPAFFMRWMDEILQANPHLRSFVKVYLDDILVHSATLEEHNDHVREVLHILRTFGMKVERRKCEFFVEGLDFLGFRVDGDGVHVDATKAAAVREWGTPASPRAVKSFLGLVGYYRKFVPGFADVARPLYTASTAKPHQFKWTSACEEGFAQLKYLVTHAPVLAIPTQDGEYIVRTDASQNAVGAVLMQKQRVDGKDVERTIAFYSRQLTPAQRNYGAYDRELLAIEEAVLHWRYYLQQAQFTVYTDHHSIQHLLSQRLTHRQMSYFATLLGYDFSIKYWPGSKNDIADALSRRYDEVIHNIDASCVEKVADELETASSRERWVRRKQERRVAYALGLTRETSLVRPKSRPEADSQVEVEDSQVDEEEPRADNRSNDSDVLALTKNDIPDSDALSQHYDEVIRNTGASCDEKAANEKATKEKASSEQWLRTLPANEKATKEKASSEQWLQHKQGRQSERALDASEVSVEPKPTREEDLAISVMATEAVVANIADVRDALISGYPEDTWLAPVWKILRAEKELQQQLDSGDFDNWDPQELKKFREATLQGVRQEISKTEWERSRRFTLSEEGVLMHKELVCIPAGDIRQNLLREVHDTMVGGHIGPAKMHVRLTQLGLYWRRMGADCRRYTKGCSTCLRVKPSNQKPMGLLHQLTVPQGRWERIGIDFITDLPPSGEAGYDAIMSVIDHLTKRAHFIPYHKATGAEATAQLFIERYFPLHGIPSSIVSDHQQKGLNCILSLLLLISPQSS
jgi:hypothetical protein